MSAERAQQTLEEERRVMNDSALAVFTKAASIMAVVEHLGVPEATEESGVAWLQFAAILDDAERSFQMLGDAFISAMAIASTMHLMRAEDA
jgi:hypothetical protein